MPLVDPSWMPNCAMKRVICHWTAGQNKASALDREHYHILIESDGRLVRGTRSIADNVSTSDGIYAAHTLRCNTGSIGVAVCCMAGAKERPFAGGACPMTRKQWDVMCEVVAELCRFYRIPITPQTVLGHGEVEVNLGIEQKGKWDPMILPWNPGLTRSEVGTFLRSSVLNVLEGPPAAEETMTVRVVVRGKEIGKAPVANGGTFTPASSVAKMLGWKVVSNGETLKFTGAGSPKKAVSSLVLDGEAYVDAENLAAQLGHTLRWEPKSRTVFIE